MENNTNEVKESKVEKEVEIEEMPLEVSWFLNNYNLTKKAKFLYENGFNKDSFQVETMDGYTEVTHNDGFKGFSVYTKGDVLFIAKPETDEADSIFSYNVIEIANATDAEYKELIKIKEKENKTSLFNILKYITAGITALGTALFFVYIVQAIVGYGLLDGLINVAPYFISIGTAVGITALLFKKK